MLYALMSEPSRTGTNSIAIGKRLLERNLIPAPAHRPHVSGVGGGQLLGLLRAQAQLPPEPLAPGAGRGVFPGTEFPERQISIRRGAVTAYPGGQRPPWKLPQPLARFTWYTPWICPSLLITLVSSSWFLTSRTMLTVA